MSRVIKFRAIDSVISLRFGTSLGQKAIVTEENSGLKSHEILARYSVVEQYTGLTDKNGTEIYEGDILENKGSVAVVKFERGMFCITPYVSLYDFAGKNKLVIGNIHQNPELLQ